jgi:hypothetical protein
MAVAAAVLSIVLAIAACDSSTTPAASPTTQSPTPSPTGGSSTASPGASQDLTAVYRAINEQVQAIRGLEERKPVTPSIVSPSELAKVLKTELDRQTPAALLEASQRLYRQLGLLSADASLSDLYGELLDSQVAGLYVPANESLYVVSKAGGVGPVERFFYSHEYDHALQDQTFDLEAFQKDLTDQTDRQLARQALVEGDAYVTMSYWLLGNLNADEQGQVLAAANDPAAKAALDKIPPIVQAPVIFPALQGTQWVLALQTQGGWPAVDAVWANPPDSTEQILHADKWTSHEAPMAVAYPADLAKRLGQGWSVVLQDTFGEYELGTWLADAGKLPQANAGAAAAGWGGDRVAMVTNGNRTGVVIDTRWDSPADAAEFAAAAQSALDALGGHGALIAIKGSDRVTVFVATDDATISALASALGLAG